MGEITFYDAVAEYVRRRCSLSAMDMISDVEFGIEYSRGCETCGYEYVALRFKVNGKYNDIEVNTISAGEFVAEVARIYTELGGK